MSRLKSCFAQLQTKGRKALIPYLTSGDPDLAATYDLVRSLEQAGADILELGVPFSDPVADGPTIQAAVERALKANTTLDGIMDLVRRIRGVSEIPIVLLVYYNTICRRGEAEFVRGCAESGVDGLVVPDLPMEESETLSAYSCGSDIDVIRMITPMSTSERVAHACKRASGFVYCVSVAGVTGARSALPQSLGQFLGEVRRGTSVPLAVGFGISCPDQAVRIASLSDGVIVGSALIERIANTFASRGREEAIKEAGRSLESFRLALDVAFSDTSST